MVETLVKLEKLLAGRLMRVGNTQDRCDSATWHFEVALRGNSNFVRSVLSYKVFA